MKRLMVLLCVLLLVCGITGTATGTPVYLSGVDSTSGWLDVEQTGYANLCWAASSSNMLAYSGWNGGFGSNSAIFGDFASHWSNEFGNPYYGINWWFDGTGEGSPAHVTTPGGGYYSGALFAANNGYDEPGYRTPDNFNANVWSYVTGNVAANRVFSMDLGDSGGGIHWLTGWGYDAGGVVWVTDSWDNTNQIFTMTLTKGADNLWYSTYGGHSWYVRAMDSLARNTGNEPPNGGGNGTVPEPTSTLLLLGIGLFGLSVGYRKRR